MIRPSLLPILASAAIAGNSPASPPLHAKETSRVSVISSMDKFRSDQQPAVASSRLELFAARGDAESSQIIISALDGELAGVTVEATDLKSDKGHELRPEVNLVGYVPVNHPSKDGFGEKGDYPDILLPLDSFNVKKGASQSVWYTVWVPRDAVPGLYEGRILVHTGSKAPQEIKVSIKVFSAVVPKQGILKTSFGYGDWEIDKPEFYGSRWNQEKETALLREMLRYRLNPTNTDIGGLVRSLKNSVTRNSAGKWEADWSAFDKEIAQKLEEGWNQFNISYLPLDWYQPDPETRVLKKVQHRWRQDLTEDDQAQILQLLNAHLVENGWTKRFAFKSFDEPSIEPENAKIISDLGNFVHQNAPNIPLFMVTTDCRERSLARDYPLFNWVPHLPSLHLDPGYEEFLVERQKKGEEAWTYICETRTFHEHTHAYPDVAPIDRSGASQRCFGPLAWRNRLDGFLYWNITSWRDRGGYMSPSNTHVGEGVLFYPDLKNYAVPVASIRAALLRDGFEDHDLLYLLDEKVKKLSQCNLSAEQAATLADAKSALNVNHLVPNLRDFNRESAAYEAHHKKVLEAFDSLTAIEATLSKK